MDFSMEGEASCSTSVRRLTLADQMSAVDSSNIRQLLLETGGSPDSFTGLSLNALLACDKLPPSQSPSTPSRSSQGLTLLDIIRSEEPKQSVGYDELIGNKDRNTWKCFRDKLRLKRAAPGFRVPGSDIPDVRIQDFSLGPGSGSVQFGSVLSGESTEQFGNSVDLTVGPARVQPGQETGSVPVDLEAVQTAVGSSTRTSENEGRSSTVQLATVLAEERQLSDRESVAVPEMVEDGEQPARMSLMELLEETDRQMGSIGSRYKMGFGEDNEDGEMCLAGRIEHTCCVCMVRHKGAAFIPCGHTFCRMCSRELWVQRGNCPLCNNHIVEVLDIF